jgi:hypothetical protein
MDGIIVSGLLEEISDNIIPFFKNSNVSVHTWDTEENSRWVNKLKRYTKLCNRLDIVVEKPLYESKLLSHFYSTYSAYQNLYNKNALDKIIKINPSLDTEDIQYKGNLISYFNKAKISNRPLLDSYKYENCIYSSIYYKTFDERFFSGHPLAFQKLFHILKKDLGSKMSSLDKELKDLYNKDYEGSIFWKAWVDKLNIPVIQDTDLIIPNNRRTKFIKY